MISNHSAQPSELQILPTTDDTDQAVATEQPKVHRRTYYALPEDDQAVAAIRAKYGCGNDSDAVRLALRLLAGDAIKVKPEPAATRRILVKFKIQPG